MRQTGEVICHFVEHFQAAFSMALALRLDKQPIIRTAPGAADYVGVQLLWDMTQLARDEFTSSAEVVLDCGDNPATVFGAVRTGWTQIAYNGPEPLLKKVSSLMASHGKQLVSLNKGPVLDLYYSTNPINDCTIWLQNVSQSQTW